ncbi:MAG: AlkA N-terminal domain-containing protein [Dehalococcoidia bacterium]|jgi:AraC family transcriptional regulator of adaptative response / DNA-3-methyladenine glycosylase II|nr:AlkA N-terminal domain-containing protein [Dehalococcoidia bacterium]
MASVQIDERQVTGVSTTGIYCRAGCGGRPKPSNTALYQSALAAQAAGFRPCLRCRPDRRADPLIDGSTHEVVRQALMLIGDGFMDRNTTAVLGKRLGISSRHLNRLFEDHIGTTPAVLAQSQRAHFARRLLDETDLSITNISSASGFRSVRQMNRVMNQIFRFTPRELRSKRRKADRLVVDGGLKLRVPCPPGFDFAAVLEFLAPRAIPGVETAVDGVYRRVTNTCGYPGVIEVSAGADGSNLEIVAHLPSFDGLLGDVARCKSLFGMDVDFSQARQELSGDPLLAPLISSRPGLTIPGSWDRFETAIRIILGQQVTVRGASTIAGRMASELGVPVPGLGEIGLGFLFPSASRLAESDLTEIGIPRARALAIRSFAEAVSDGSLDLYDHSELPALLSLLQGYPGVGPWTANMLAMRVFGHMDAFPLGDMGLRKAFAGLSSTGSAAGELIEETAQNWRPWRSLAFNYLLRSHIPAATVR